MNRLHWIVLCFLFAGSAKADSDLLHEYIPNVSPNEADRAISARSSDRTAVVYNGQRIEMPGVSGLSNDEPMVPMTSTPSNTTSQSEIGRRSPRFSPDRTTQFQGSLSYYDVFNPSIAPFKRMTAMGVVRLAEDGKTPELTPLDSIRRKALVEGLDAAQNDARPRDRFWGDVLLDFSGGPTVPLPSVSPESRILLLDSLPRTNLRIEKDGDDNFYAIALDANHPNSVRLRFMTDAPRTYFGTAIPDVASTVLAREISPLPASLKKRAEQFAKELGLTAGDSLRTVLSTLTRHFRSFEEATTPPRDTGDIYLDLVRGLKGICRHRAYGFVITAQALGVPARFLQNEAHSWVEVKLPGLGWMRIDLGGAAQRIEAHGMRDKVAYWPAWPDELPRPPQFEEAYREASRTATAVSLNRVDQVAGRWLADGPTVAAPKQGVRPDKALLQNERQRKNAIDQSRIAIRIDQKRVAVIRGQPLEISGQAVGADARGIRGVDIELSLTLSGQSGRLLLGATKSDEAGFFRGSFEVPADIAVGDYQISARVR
jgi:hypothetical protein